MVSAEVVQTPNDIHASQQGLGLAGQGAGPPGQNVEPLAEGGIEPFNESGIDAPVTLRDLDQVPNLVSTTLHNPAADLQFARARPFDHLHDRQFGPSAPFTATPLTVTRICLAFAGELNFLPPLFYTVPTRSTLQG